MTEQDKRISIKLALDEHRQKSYQQHVETYENEIRTLEKTLKECKKEDYPVFIKQFSPCKKYDPCVYIKLDKYKLFATEYPNEERLKEILESRKEGLKHFKDLVEKDGLPLCYL